MAGLLARNGALINVLTTLFKREDSDRTCCLIQLLNCADDSPAPVYVSADAVSGGEVFAQIISISGDNTVYKYLGPCYKVPADPQVSDCFPFNLAFSIASVTDLGGGSLRLDSITNDGGRGSDLVLTQIDNCSNAACTAGPVSTTEYIQGIDCNTGDPVEIFAYVGMFPTDQIVRALGQCVTFSGDTTTTPTGPVVVAATAYDTCNACFGGYVQGRDCDGNLVDVWVGIAFFSHDDGTVYKFARGGVGTPCVTFASADAADTLPDGATLYTGDDTITVVTGGCDDPTCGPCPTSNDPPYDGNVDVFFDWTVCAGLGCPSITDISSVLCTPTGQGAWSGSATSGSGGDVSGVSILITCDSVGTYGAPNANWVCTVTFSCGGSVTTGHWTKPRTGSTPSGGAQWTLHDKNFFVSAPECPKVFA